MPIIKQSENTFEPVPQGTHPARCCGMVSLGTQPSNHPKYQPSFKVVLMFEFPNEIIEIKGERKPMMTNHFLSAYLGSTKKPSKAAQFLTSWRGRAFTEQELAGFDLSKVIGAPCLLGIVHEDRGGSMREVISSISPLPKGMAAPPAITKPIHFEVEDGRGDKFKALPEWMQKMIESCEEWTSPKVAAPEPSDNDGDNVETDGPGF